MLLFPLCAEFHIIHNEEYLISRVRYLGQDFEPSGGEMDSSEELEFVLVGSVCE